jgi:hypothetical protein
LIKLNTEFLIYYCRRSLACEALVIGSVAGLALTAGLLSFQVLTDRKAARTEDGKKIATSGTITY